MCGRNLPCQLSIELWCPDLWEYNTSLTMCERTTLLDLRSLCCVNMLPDVDAWSVQCSNNRALSLHKCRRLNSKLALKACARLQPCLDHLLQLSMYMWWFTMKILCLGMHTCLWLCINRSCTVHFYLLFVGEVGPVVIF